MIRHLVLKAPEQTMKTDTSSTTVRQRKPIVVRELPLKSSRHYTIVDKLGSGRTGDVFLAKYTLSAPKQKPRRRMGRHVAIKIFRDDFKVCQRISCRS